VTYYYSCACGEKGSEAFAHGELADHDWTEENVCTVCEMRVDEGLRFALNEMGTYKVTGYIGTQSTLHIPSMYKEIAVTEIGHTAFFQNVVIMNVTLPDSITSIGNFAFDNCTPLSNIFYDGTKREWEDLVRNIAWNPGVSGYTVHCNDGEIYK